jgi:hypothetical protein
MHAHFARIWIEGTAPEGGAQIQTMFKAIHSRRRGWKSWNLRCGRDGGAESLTDYGQFNRLSSEVQCMS